jgi:hypothetical protein
LVSTRALLWLVLALLAVTLVLGAALLVVVFK